MSDKLKLLKGEPQHEKTNDRGIGNSPGVGQSDGTVLDNPAWRNRPRPWLFAPSDTSPLAWWRMLPSNAFGDAECLHLLTTLKQIDVLHGGDDFAAALEGDPSAAIGVAIALMPIEELTLKADIAMTALLMCALERNATAALVLAQVLGLTDLGHAFVTELAASWLAYGRRYAADPRKFHEAETVLLEAFRDRRRYGDDA